MTLQRRVLVFLCKECVSVVRKIPLIVKKLENRENEVGLIRQTSMQENKVVNMNATKEEKSYRDVMLNKKEVIIVKPKNKKNTQRSKKDLNNKIDPVKLKLNVNIGRNVGEGGVVIECNSDTKALKAKKQIEKSIGSEYDVKLPKKVYPKIKVIGIPSDINMDKEEIRNKIIEQNDINVGVKNCLVNVFHLTQVNKGYYNALIEVDVETDVGCSNL